ncbi:hypothetical protein AN403_3104 [Pseudomonas fluorescens]|uniref:Uncharacterized protein n=1 Tax=Pseudomonas fluorescens TaxID=294 RepID=A0A0P8X1A4_PSEFL|nr:hypothetical protein [Pseudomonas fluorescens]KPU59468.1 hypothetical protein AN403_3104 [Pseudomonas fluorescens]
MSYSQNVCDLEYGSDLEYEEFEEFHWLGCAGVTYEASIALQCKIIRMTLDDFEQYYTVHQAADVARCIFDALVAIEEINPGLFSPIDSSTKAKTYLDVFKCFASDRISGTKFLEDGLGSLEILPDPDYLFIAGGEFVDPDPRIEFRSREDAIFRMFVATEIGETIEMVFGGYMMEFTANQALWLWFYLSIASDSLHHRSVSDPSSEILKCGLQWL